VKWRHVEMILTPELGDNRQHNQRQGQLCLDRTPSRSHHSLGMTGDAAE
jgi:hypothetical protein